MAKNDASRQRKLMKKRQKDKLRHKARAPSSGSGHNRKLILQAQSHPIHECVIARNWQKHGLAQILLSRVQPDENLIAGLYLVDTLCLGLKNTVAEANLSRSAYRAQLRDRISRDEGCKACPLDLAHTIIYGAIDYARQFGFEPHKDFKLSRHILQERDDFTWREDVEFGRDGMPLFVSGPHDNANRIIRQLQATAGEGNFHYLIGGPAGP